MTPARIFCRQRSVHHCFTKHQNEPVPTQYSYLLLLKWRANWQRGDHGRILSALLSVQWTPIPVRDFCDKRWKVTIDHHFFWKWVKLARVQEKCPFKDQFSVCFSSHCITKSLLRWFWHLAGKNKFITGIWSRSSYIHNLRISNTPI